MFFYFRNASGRTLDVHWGRSPDRQEIRHGLLAPDDQETAHDQIGMAPFIRPGERIWAVGSSADGSVVHGELEIVQDGENILVLG